MNWSSRELTREWAGWWKSQTLFYKLWPIVAVAVYWLALYAIGGLRGDHFMMGVPFAALYYAGPRIRPLYWFVLPFILVGVVYDSMRFYGDALRQTIHIAEPYNFDKRFFGIETTSGRLTPNEWWNKHTHPVIDAFTGFAYLTYVIEYFLVAAFFFFIVSRSPGVNPRLARSAPFAFLAMNLIGYITYFLYPAAPPWYAEAYGFSYVANAVPSPAGALRFDALIGSDVFKGMYSKSANVYGAIPSLHVAYPLGIAYLAFKLKRLRVFTTLFALLVAFAAVYLNHHYVLDVLWGWAYALLVMIPLCHFLHQPKKLNHG